MVYNALRQNKYLNNQSNHDLGKAGYVISRPEKLMLMNQILKRHGHFFINFSYRIFQNMHYIFNYTTDLKYYFRFYL